jgi:hypothetical protein
MQVVATQRNLGGFRLRRGTSSCRSWLSVTGFVGSSGSAFGMTSPRDRLECAGRLSCRSDWPPQNAPGPSGSQLEACYRSFTGREGPPDSQTGVSAVTAVCLHSVRWIRVHSMLKLLEAIYRGFGARKQTARAEACAPHCEFDIDAVRTEHTGTLLLLQTHKHGFPSNVTTLHFRRCAGATAKVILGSFRSVRSRMQADLCRPHHTDCGSSPHRLVCHRFAVPHR